MPENAVGLLAKNYAIAHGRVLASAEGTDDGHFTKSMGTRVHSVAWQGWHIARWGERYAGILVEKTPELPDRVGPPPQNWSGVSPAEKTGVPIRANGPPHTRTGNEGEA